MSNIINNLLLNETPSSASTNSVTSEQGVKETPSLFDSLLLANSPKEEVVSEVTTSVDPKIEKVAVSSVDTKEVKVDNIKVEVDTNTSIPVEEVKNEEVIPTEKQTTSTTSSLLDRLIIESKNDLKEIKSEELNNKINNSLVDTKIEEIKVSSDVKEVKVDSSKIETAITSSIPVEETKNQELISTDKTTPPTSSLLDKLIVDAKNLLADTKEIKVDTSKVDTLKVETDINSSIPVEEIKSKEEISSDKATSTTSSLLDKLIVDAKNTLLTDKNTKEVKVDKVKVEVDTNTSIPVEEVIPTEKQTTSTTSSLLDRLIIESKNDLKEIKSEELNNKINNSLVDTKIEEIKVSSDVKEVKVDSSKIETAITSSIPVEETKNQELISTDKTTPPTSSLLDKLIVDTKEVNKLIVDNVAILDDNTENITKTIVNEVTVNVIPLEDEDIDKSVITTTKVIDENQSLMDKLIQKNSEKIVSETTETVDIDSGKLPLKEAVTKDLITNIYLGSQKNQINNQTLFNKNEAITILKEGNSVQAIKTSAEILDLGLEDIDVQQIIEDKLDIKKSNVQIDNKKNLIDSLLTKIDIKSNDIKELITTSVEASKALAENNLNLAEDVTVNVNSPLSYNIQSKIIGAKQQMATMMSDIARQMYDNYKAPVTAFRINLNPQDLGSIAILMKSDRNSGLSISMNVSNNTTLDTLIENQNVLKNSLNKTFSDNTKFNLDFNSSSENSSNQSSSNQNSRQNNKKDQQMDTESILKLQEENKDREEKIIDYM